MTVELEPGQIEVTHPAVGSLLIGEGTPYTISEFEVPGLGELTANDTDRSGGDGKVFNVDTRGGTTIPLTFFVDTDNIVDASRAWSEAMRVWNAAAVRADAGAVVAFRARPFNLPTRVAYGRPRNIDPARAKFVDRGVLDLVTSFDTDDGLWYADPADVVPIDISITPPQAGGFTVPFTFPLAIATTAEGTGTFVVDGAEATPLVARIYGPSLNPEVEYLDHWRFRLMTSLRRDQWIDLDARPGRRTVLRSDGVNLSGAFDADSPPLSDLLLEPGPAHMVFRGVDETGLSKVTVSWQGAGHHPYWV